MDNMGDSPVQPDVNNASQYKAANSYQVEDSIHKTTNYKMAETSAPATPESECSSWTVASRDWGEEVERAADVENDFDSSPQHRVDPAQINDVKQKQMLRGSQMQNIASNDQVKYSGKGKYKVKSSTSDYEKLSESDVLLCNNSESNSDPMPLNQVETHVAEDDSSCNSPVSEDTCHSDIAKDSLKKNTINRNFFQEDMLPVQSHMNGTYPPSDFRTRNMPVSNIDHSRDFPDYKKMTNGMGYRNNKPFRMNRVPNNNSNSLQFNKGYDNRTFARYAPQPPMSLNVKNNFRPKAHEVHYRQHDNRRHPQSSSRPPSYQIIEKTVYGKHKNMYTDRDNYYQDVNKNFSQNFNELNRGPVPFVPQSNILFRPKHPNSRIGNCDKLLCNKNEPSNNNLKRLGISGAITDSNTLTVSCHSRTVVTPMKSMTCTTHPQDKSSSLKEDNLQAYPNACENFSLDHSQPYSSMDIEPRVKYNNSPAHEIRDTRISHDDKYASNCDRLSFNEHSNSNRGNYMPSSDIKTKNLLIDKTNSSDSSDAYLREMGFLQKDHTDKVESSPIVSSGNVPLTEQLSGEYCGTDASQNIVLLDDSSFVGSSVSPVPHSSYADVMRIPNNAIGKVSSCQISNCVEVTKSNEFPDPAHGKVTGKLEADHSSDWVQARLSHVDLNATNMVTVNGMAHQVTPRPIAVSLEKPSFFNSKTGVSSPIVHVQASNLSSPERKLECQYVEEQFGSMLGYKKSGEKVTYLSDLSSVGESSSVPANVRADSTFSDTSSVCSSMSGTFKGDGHYQILKPSPPAVIIMNSYGNASEGVSEISFGIEMEEIMKLCGDSDLDSVGDSSMTILSDSGFCSNKILDVGTCEGDDDDTCILNEDDEYITIGNKKFLWKDKVDISQCNMSQIVGFLQENVGDNISSGIKFYSEE